MTDLFDEKKLLKKLPKKIENWKVKDVLVFLEMVELDDYEKVFGMLTINLNFIKYYNFYFKRKTK